MSLGTWKGHIIALDIKSKGGDLVRPLWYINRYSESRQSKIFNPMEKFWHYDPYALLKNDGRENLVHNAIDLALALLPTPQKITGDEIWIKMAQNLVTAMILYYFSCGASFNETMLALQMYSTEEKKIMDSDDSKDIGNYDAIIAAKMYVSKMVGLKPEILAGIGMDLGKIISLAVDPLIRSAFNTKNKSCVIDWADLNSSEEPYDVILQISEDKLEQWESMTMLMLNQLIKTLERRADNIVRREESCRRFLLY